MKSTGIIRKVDELGRIVIPMEFRRTFGIDTKDSLEVHTDGKSIILSKFKQACFFCSSTGDVRTYKGKKVCRSCRRAISALS